MKTNQISILLASLILGISFIIGCSFINNEKVLEAEPMQDQVVIADTVDKPLMSIAEAADFLNMTEEQVLTIIKAEHEVLSLAGSFSGVMFPYIKVDNKFYISKEDLLFWIKDASVNKRNYQNGKIF